MLVLTRSSMIPLNIICGRNNSNCGKSKIEYRDDKNTLDMSVKRIVTIDSEGPIKILGSGTANPRTEERYTDLCHEIYEGRMIAVVRANIQGQEL